MARIDPVLEGLVVSLIRTLRGFEVPCCLIGAAVPELLLDDKPSQRTNDVDAVVLVPDLPAFDRDAATARYDLWHGYRKLERDGASAAFPFGFGLSYTSFAYSGFRAERAGDAVRATVTVANTGARAGEEVVQIYVRAPGSPVERARRELKAFARVHLEPGASAPVTLQIPVSELAWYDEKRGWVVEPGRYLLLAGRDAEDADALEAVVSL